jgi:hypothetical protein
MKKVINSVLGEQPHYNASALVRHAILEILAVEVDNALRVI